MNCETEQDFIEYGRRLYREHRQGVNQESQPVDLLAASAIRTPVGVRADSESDYRRGFQHGFYYAIQVFEKISRKGYSRVTEMVNLAADFEHSVLLPWRYRAHWDVVKGVQYFGHPFFRIEKWSDVRHWVFRRDGFRCQECGSGKKLHCDHVVPVHQGGLPSESNLQTLCRDCNLAKGSR